MKLVYRVKEEERQLCPFDSSLGTEMSSCSLDFVFLFCCLFKGPHQAMLRDYLLLCVQESLLVGSRDHMGCWGVEPSLTVCKAIALSAVLWLWPLKCQIAQTFYNLTGNGRYVG